VMRLRSTAPGLQTLYVNVLLGRGEGGFGEGRRLRPDDRLDTGIYTFGDVPGGRRYIGIAGPRTASVRVAGRRVAVVEGFYSFVARSRHPRVHELDAAGAVIRTFRSRN
jgi:hypothetical protein